MASTEHVVSSKDSTVDIIITIGLGLLVAYIITKICYNGNCVLINKTCNKEKHLFQNNYRTK